MLLGYFCLTVISSSFQSYKTNLTVLADFPAFLNLWQADRQRSWSNESTMISLLRIYQLRSERYAAYFILLCKQAFPGALRRWLCYFKKQWTSVCASFEPVILVVYCHNSRGRVTHFRRATPANYLVSASIGVHHFIINHSHHDASLTSLNSVHVTGN